MHPNLLSVFFPQITLLRSIQKLFGTFSGSNRAAVMVFMCQSDSYLTHFKTTVVACQPTECKIDAGNGKLQKIKGFNVELEDTILFPEGGGQPDDRGKINEHEVKRVIRKADKALHFIEKEIEVGQIVDVDVDWKRRFDHMQQHSAQHLITAIADHEYGYKTTSWDLGKSVSFIELDTPNISEEQRQNIEKLTNKAIQDSVAVQVHVTQVGSPLLKSVRARGLPEDHVGDVRIVDMQGIDANMCCGTHVSNLSHLQCIKLLSVEKGKKGKTNLFFLAGDRILAYNGKCYNTEKELTKLLKCGPDQHVQAVERSIKQLKLAQKNCTTLLRDIAVLEASRFKLASEDQNRLLVLHRKEGNNEFMNIISNELPDTAYLFLTVGDEKGEGMFLLKGPGTFIENCGEKVAEAICGKGLAKGTKMQGKAEKLQRKDQALLTIKEYISKQES
uniref:Alanyl-tRNA editing protein Aarsd1-like n=1 Tax=Phallusia mammillata TaxID=59560 RepID=A0A6F9D5Y8_9ASCI|nr:alanyl-tRNA editing protein Aarsd1-like [Phallusia mammillata]